MFTFIYEYIACLQDQNKSGFLEGWLLFSQSEQSEKFSKSPIGWKKAGPPKSHFCFDHVNRLIYNSIGIS